MKMLSIVKKNLVVICCLCLFMSILSVNVSAQGNDKNVNAVVVINEPYVVETDNGHLIFDNYLDMVDYLILYGLNISDRKTCLPGDPWYPTCENHGDKYETRQTVVKSEVQTVKTGDHTNNWEKVSSYTLTNGSNLEFNATLIFDSASLSVSVNFWNSVGKTYSADQNRFSKLVGMMEVQLTKYKNEVYDPKTNKVIKTYYYTEHRILNTYSEVVYR